MPTSSARLGAWNLAAASGTTVTVAQTWTYAAGIPGFTAGDPVDLAGGVTIYTGGTDNDLDDYTGATAIVATISGNVATADIPIPAGGTPILLRTAIAGAAKTVGKLMPRRRGGASDTTVDVLAGTAVEVNISVIGTLTEVTDGDKGDITVTAAGSTWTIDNGAVTAAKVAPDVATQAELDAEAATRNSDDNAIIAQTQPLSSTLTDLSAFDGFVTADKVPYSTPSAWDLAALTAFARTLLDDPTAAAARATLNVPAVAELTAEAALARNADNLTAGIVADARVAATIARDTEVTAAIAAIPAPAFGAVMPCAAGGPSGLGTFLSSVAASWWRLDSTMWPAAPSGKTLQYRVVVIGNGLTSGDVLGGRILDANTFVEVFPEFTGIADGDATTQAVSAWQAWPASPISGFVEARNQTAARGAVPTAWIEVMHRA